MCHICPPKKYPVLWINTYSHFVKITDLQTIPFDCIKIHETCLLQLLLQAMIMPPCHVLTMNSTWAETASKHNS